MLAAYSIIARTTLVSMTGPRSSMESWTELSNMTSNSVSRLM